MRIYRNFTEALSEIKRDLAEMGINIHTQTYQDKYIGDKEEMATKELQNYIYTVTEPYYDRDLKPIQPWADAEFQERINFKSNPGEAWKLREEIWTEFIQPDGTFAYSYGDRLAWQVEEIVKTLTSDPSSRQAFMGMWNAPTDIERTGGISRVPCTLGYHFQIRKNKLNITYLQRSADYATHFVNDIYLAGRMHTHIFQLLLQEQGLGGGLEIGSYTHWIGSLHVFNKDIKGVF